MDQSNTKTTVLLPVGSNGTELERTLASLSQMEGDFELIILAELGHKLLSDLFDDLNKDERCKIVWCESSSLAIQLNLGIQKSTSNHLAIALPGDTYYPGRLICQRRYLDTKTDVVCVGSSVEYSSGDSGYTVMYPEAHSQLVLYLLGHGRYYPGSFYFRKKELLEIGGFRDVGESTLIDCLFRLAAIGTIANVKEALVSRPLIPSGNYKHQVADSKASMALLVHSLLTKSDDATLYKFLQIEESPERYTQWRSATLERRACRGIRRVFVHRGTGMGGRLLSRVSRKAWRKYSAELLENVAILCQGRTASSYFYLRAFVKSWNPGLLEKALYSLLFGGGYRLFGSIPRSKQCDKEELTGFKLPGKDIGSQHLFWKTVPTKSIIERWVIEAIRRMPVKSLHRWWTGINIQQLKSLKKELPHGRACIVANGPSTSSSEWGAEVDDSDCVIRINHFMTTGMEKYVGNRTDLWLTNYFEIYAQPLDSLTSHVDKIFFRMPLSYYSFLWTKKGAAFERNKEKLKHLENKSIYCPDDEFLREIASLFPSGLVPTTGTLALLLLMNFGFTDFLILGMDFYSDPEKTYYSGSNTIRPWLHELDEELEVLSQRIQETGSVVHCPEPLYSKLVAGVNSDQVKLMTK